MGRSKTFEALDLAGKFYEAALCPDLLSPLLKSVAEHLHSTSASLLLCDRTSSKVNVIQYSGDIDESLFNEYRDYYGQLDMPAKCLPTNRVMQTADMFAKHPETWCAEYEEDFIKRAEIYDRIGFNAQLTEDQTCTLAIQRGRKKRYGKQEHRLLELLMPHIQKAMRLHLKMSATAQLQEILSSGFERFGFGVILCNQSARPILVNNSARSLLQRHPVLKITRTSVEAADTGQNRRLQRLLHNAAQCVAGDAADGDDTVRINCDGHTLNITVFPMAMHSVAALPLSKATAALVIVDPAGLAVPPNRLIRMYGLTKAEARLALEVTRGLSLQEISEKRHTSINTLRAQLKGVFVKMDAQRQSDVVRGVVQAIPGSIFTPN